MNSANIRTAARRLLRGRFAPAIVVSLALGAALALALIFLDAGLFLAGLVDYESGEFVFTQLSQSVPVMAAFLLVLAVCWVLLGMPLKIGVCRWFFALADFGYPAVDCLFSAFRGGSYRRSLGLCLRLFALRILWTLLCCLPGLLVSGFGLMLGDTPEGSDLYDIGITLFTAGFVLSAVICLRYFLANYIFASSENITGKEAVKISVDMMKGRKASLVGLVFGFFGWFLLTVPTFGICLIYTVPYYHTSLGIFAKGSIDTSLALQRQAQSAANSAENI